MNPLDEVEGIDHLRQILAGNAEPVGSAQADPDEDGIVVAVEIGHLQVAADLDAVAKLDAESLDHPHLVEAHLGPHLVVGDPVGVEPATGRLLVVDGDRVPQPGEFRSAAESGGAGAEDRDPPAVLRMGRMEHVDPVGSHVVGGMTLKPADLDRILFQVEHHAGAFAEHLRGADAGAARPEHVGLEDRPGGPGQVVGGDLADERGNIDPRGAGHDARSVETEEAATRLDSCLLR